MTDDITTIAQLLDSIKTEKTSIKAALEAVDVQVGDTPFTGYAELIHTIRRYKEPDTSSLYNIDYHVQQDTTEGYAAKVIYLMQANESSTTFSGASAYRTSDGAFYQQAEAEHTWDLSKDETLSGANKIRYVIAYFDSAPLTEIPAMPDCTRIVVEGAVLEDCRELFADKFPKLVDIEFIRTTVTGTDFSGMFAGAQALKSVKGLDTSAGTDFSYMYSRCRQLVVAPSHDLSAGVQFSYMYAYCPELVRIPHMNTDSGTGFAFMCAECPKLQRVGNINTAVAQAVTSMFAGDTALTTVGTIPMSSVTDYDNMFKDCSSLAHLAGFPGLKYDLNLGDVSQSLTRDSMLYIMEGLDSSNPGTQTFGPQNLLKLLVNDTDIATAKGWVIQ